MTNYYKYEPKDEEDSGTSHNTPNNDAPFIIERNYCCRSTLLLHNEFVF
jgi:hypothetical protein